ncbi:hypothetical protein QTH91_15150 [Variovorax dokdonensis]|uniref:Type IV pilus assembly protein PilW n=1 Tax=Variovorax dokdonensis TaxID=344883 RepID=A0ABT7ND16_9BURK|nr:hypothetical protein [Variovorax dokdonensis]MDM0045823.1 hypothetical protein [Variovorax dokdonensis]
MSSPERMKRHRRCAAHLVRGALLVELMVGLTVGGLVTLAALAVLQTFGQTQRIVDDQSQLLQQAGFVFRLLGQQIRTAGSRDIEAAGDADPTTGATPYRYVAQATSANTTVVRGTSGMPHDTLTLAAAAYIAPDGVRRDCLGQKASTQVPLAATFQVDAGGVLRCKSSSGQNQPIAFGVAAFRIRYRLRNGEAMRDLDASAIEQADQWRQVVAVAVCIDLRGDAVLAGTEQRYVDCEGKAATDKTRRHLVLQRLFHLRADGLT